jgi:hypothetical protein
MNLMCARDVRRGHPLERVGAFLEARWEIHLEGLIHGYKGKVHLAVVVVEGLVVLAFLASGPVLFLDPDGVLQFAVAGGVAVAVLAMGLLTSWLGDRFGVKSGTELAPHCRLLKALRKGIFGRLDHVRFVEWLDRRLDLKAPVGHVSYPVLWTVAALITVMGANASSVGKLAYGVLSEQPHPSAAGVYARVHQPKRRPPQTEQCPQVTVATLKPYVRRAGSTSYS